MPPLFTRTKISSTLSGVLVSDEEVVHRLQNPDSLIEVIEPLEGVAGVDDPLLFQLLHDRRTRIGEVQHGSDPEPLVLCVLLDRGFLVGQETQVILQPEFFVGRIFGEVQVQPLHWEGIGAVPPCVLLLLGEAAVERDVQRRQPLLAIEHRGGARSGGNRALVGVGVVSLVKVREELVERVRLSGLGFDIPKEERTDRVPAHETVEQPDDLAGPPDELPLDRGHEVLVLVDCGQHLLDAARCLK